VSAKDLSLAQAATLAGIVQNPNTYRVDKPGGSIINADGVGFNKAPDGLIDDVGTGQLAALDTLLAEGTITQEQYLAAADGYSASKGRQLYVLSRMLDDGKITQEQYVAAGHRTAHPGDHSRDHRLRCRRRCRILLPVRQEHHQDRPGIRRNPRGPHPHASARWPERLHDARLPRPGRAEQRCGWARVVEGMSTLHGKFGSAAVSIEADDGRILSIAQNTLLQRGRDAGDDPN
jgi:hypothetical protein